MRNFKRFLLFVLLKFVKGEIQGGCFRSQEVSEGGKVTEYCLECDRGYAQEIIKTTSTGEKYVNCKKCLIENCDICEFQTPEKCTSCLNKFFLEENSCLNCPKECWKCNNLDECEECDTGYFFRLGSTTPKKM